MLISALLSNRSGDGRSGGHDPVPTTASAPTGASSRPGMGIEKARPGNENPLEKIIELLATISGMLTHYLERRKPARDKLLLESKPVVPGPEARPPPTPLSVGETGRKPTDIWGGFYQSVEGNCVTVSAIKAAMTRFGQSPLAIYERITADADGYEVVMRDNYRLHITRQELEQAAQASAFAGSDSAMLEDANFLYAVSAKRAHEENNEDTAGQSFAAALDTLNDGEVPGEAFRRLGLYAWLRESSVTELAQGAIGTLAYDCHSVAVIGGREERYGVRGEPPPIDLEARGMYQAYMLV